MGFFNKKEEKKDSLPPMPPAPVGEVKKVDEVKETGKLTPPPVPGSSHLDDIKSQVISNGNSNLSLEQGKNEENNFDLNNNLNPAENSNDSLFDLSEFDIPMENEVNPDLNDENLVLEDNKESKEEINIKENIDTHNISELNFERNGLTKNIKEKETIFITTSQFKFLLSIVDSVKSRVKEASNTHLRLLDIKSEENLEYENLKKSFQFIEDKLYEVDNLIFEK